uniref:Uncharacterized protein n=1 Tax=Utricularia reniformis TaxID=192314 RepID=A0A1Y0AZG8_9LAMI|nr:hypothetical protein AEK19_MT0256 [Utricularia reniformis]ART30533.1 hypothetical protein AEK19_MT0256 [Utricularia reniformis]
MNWHSIYLISPTRCGDEKMRSFESKAYLLGIFLVIGGCPILKIAVELVSL